MFGRLSVAAALVLFASGLSLVTPASAQSSLTTTFAGGNGQAGNMFDVVTFGKPVTISRLGMNLNAGNATVEVYRRPGSWQANPGSAAGWTLVGTVNVTSVGNGAATIVDVPDFTLNANETTGLYVTTTGTGVAYTNGTGVGNVFAQNADLQILEGAGLPYPFGGTFTPRVWNGTIFYGEGAPQVADTRTKTQQTIQRYLSRRNDQLLANGPDFNLPIPGLSGQ